MKAGEIYNKSTMWQDLPEIVEGLGRPGYPECEIPRNEHKSFCGDHVATYRQWYLDRAGRLQRLLSNHISRFGFDAEINIIG